MNPYASAAAFKQAVEIRIRSSSSSGIDFARRRQLLVFDRFLARITRELGDSVILEGGLVVELRVERARTTKDIDLRLVGSPTGLLERLRRAAELELDDFMVFSVAPDAEHPRITNEGMVYEGQRYRVGCVLAGKPYGQLFGLDIAFADPIFGEPDLVERVGASPPRPLRLRVARERSALPCVSAPLAHASRCRGCIGAPGAPSPARSTGPQPRTCRQEAIDLQK